MSSVRVAKGRRPVALATGFIDRVRPGVKRKQVVVVLTESFTVLCFDHRLRLLWETTLNHMEESLGLGHLVPNEVSVFSCVFAEEVVPTQHASPKMDVARLLGGGHDTTIHHQLFAWAW